MFIGIPLPGEVFDPFPGGKIPPPPPPPVGVMLAPVELHAKSNLKPVEVSDASSTYPPESSVDRVSSTTSDKITPEVENVQTIQVLGSRSGNFQSPKGVAGRNFPSTLQETHKPLSFSISSGQRKPFIGKKKNSLNIFEEDSGESENDDINDVITLPRTDVSPTLHSHVEEQSNLINIPTSYNLDAKSHFHVDSSSTSNSAVNRDYEVQQTNLISVVLSESEKPTITSDWVDSSTEKLRLESSSLSETKKVDPDTPSHIPTLISRKAGASSVNLTSPELDYSNLPPSEVSSTSNEPFLLEKDSDQCPPFSDGESTLTMLPRVGSLLPPKPQRVVTQEHLSQVNVIAAPSGIDSLKQPLPTRKQRRFREYELESTFSTSEQTISPLPGQRSFGFETKATPAEPSLDWIEPVSGETKKTIPDTVLNKSKGKEGTEKFQQEVDSSSVQSEPVETGFDLCMGSIDEEPLLHEKDEAVSEPTELEDGM